MMDEETLDMGERVFPVLSRLVLPWAISNGIGH